MGRGIRRRLQRAVKRTRVDWINKFKTVMRKGTPKEKLRFQYYRRFTEEGNYPKMYQKPAPVTPPAKTVMDVEMLMDVPGKWERRWEGEPKELSDERQEMNGLEWGRMMKGFIISKKAAVQKKYSFYIQLLKKGELSKPIEVPVLEPATRLRTCEDPEEPEEVTFSQSVVSR